MRHLLTGFSLFVCVILSEAQVSIQLNVPPIVPNSEVTLEIKINKGAVTNFAKYQIDVPPGVYLSEGDNKTGSFSFDNNRAKVIWVSIPTEPEFVITMKLNPGTATGVGTINQKFYYLENGARKEVEAAPLSVNFSGGPAVSSSNSPAAPVANIRDEVAPEPVKPADPAPESNPKPAETETVASNNTIAEITTATPPAAEPEKPAAPAKESSAETIRKLKEQFDAANASTPAETPAAAKTPKPAATASTASGISYKVQLGAYGEKPGMGKYVSLKGVAIVKEDNFYKVLYGNFKTREEAASKRDELLGKGFKGFVVAYQNGARVK